MKWVAFIIGLAAIMPLSAWLRRNPRQTPKIWMLLGFLPFAPVHVYMAIINWNWVGTVRGGEVTILDFLALALYLSLRGTHRPLPFRISMALYFIAVLLSVFQAGVPIAALFYALQLARMFLVYAAVTSACADPRVAPAIMNGMAAGLLMEACVVIFQRFALGMLQTPGTVGHQNLLGLLSHFIIFPFFALLLDGRRGWLPPAVIVAGIVTEVLTTSRATIGLAGLGYVAVFVLSSFRQWSSRKAMFCLAGAASIAVIIPLALTSLEKRGSADFASSNEERAAFENVAAMMLSDHPLGVGANHYIYSAVTEGYYIKAGLGGRLTEGGNVHNMYWLVAAETGYPGIIAFVLLLLRPLTVAFLCAWRYRGDPRGDLLVGLGVALLVVYIHSTFEWSLAIFETQYILAMSMGLVAGTAQQLGFWKAARGSEFPRNRSSRQIKGEFKCS